MVCGKTMISRNRLPQNLYTFIGFLALLISTLACARTIKDDDSPIWSASEAGYSAPKSGSLAAVKAAGIENQLTPGGPVLTPTPNQPRTLPTLRADSLEYQVGEGDTLGTIGRQFGITWEQIAETNKMDNPNVLEVGQKLMIPPPTAQGTAPDFKVIPDSELVYGPASASLNIEEFIDTQAGYLSNYQEEVEEQKLSGAQIVEKISQDFSVNPRLLLAVLEHQSGWVTKTDIKKEQRKYPLGLENPERDGLYFQLAYAANNLNRGYYLWRVNGVGHWVLADGTILLASPTINAGTAGVQHFFSTVLNRESWEQAVSEDGLFATYSALFGNPFIYTIEPLLPSDLIQPPMQLPFEQGEKWAYTGGPHSGWGDGSAWAALDFAPPGDATGCVQSDSWVVAAADGLVTRSEQGAVIQDLDGDGLEQTGWVLLYMHVESRDRVKPGTFLKAGEPIGHPSCEGGISSGTHVHIARRYNGEWISADKGIPFVLDRWISYGSGNEYDGYLERGRKQVEAYAGRSSVNLIAR